MQIMPLWLQAEEKSRRTVLQLNKNFAKKAVFMGIQNALSQSQREEANRQFQGTVSAIWHTSSPQNTQNENYILPNALQQCQVVTNELWTLELENYSGQKGFGGNLSLPFQEDNSGQMNLVPFIKTLTALQSQKCISVELVNASERRITMCLNIQAAVFC